MYPYGRLRGQPVFYPAIRLARQQMGVRRQNMPRRRHESGLSNPFLRLGATMHRVGLIVPYDFQLLSLAPLTAFEMTAFELAKPPPAPPHYDLHLLSQHGGPFRSSCGLTVETEAFGDPAFDTIIVGAITAFEITPSTASLIAFVQEAAKKSRRTASFCNRSFVLAEAGLLDGR